MLWSIQADEKPSCPPAFADLNTDGVLDCVMGSTGHEVYAFSGRDGQLLWKSSIDQAAGERAAQEPEWVKLADVNRDGILDCVAGDASGLICTFSGRDGSRLGVRIVSLPSADGPPMLDLDGDGSLDTVEADLDDSQEPRVQARSGKSGALLWGYQMKDWVACGPTLADMNGDGVLDWVVGAQDGGLSVGSCKDGALLWSYRRSGEFPTSAAVADFNHDGLPDLLVVWGDHIQAVAGRHLPTTVTRFGERRQHGNWKTLSDEATASLKESKAPWVKALCWSHLGLARLHLGDAEGARGALAEARGLGTRSPEGAVFEWLASWRWGGCPKNLREDAQRILQDAIISKPHSVFDGFCEVRDMLTQESLENLALSTQDLPSDDARIATTMLLAVINSRPDAPADMVKSLPPLFPMVEQAVVAKIKAGDKSLARWYGYLALLADIQGDGDRFRRAYEVYLTLPFRRPSLDGLLADVAAKDAARASAGKLTAMPHWMRDAIDGLAATKAGDYQRARLLCEQALAAAAGDPWSSFPSSQQLFQMCHHDLARIYSLASIGKDSPSTEARKIDPTEAGRLRDRAFEQLQTAIDAGGIVAEDIAGQIRQDPDFAPLHDDARWSLVLKRLPR